MRGTKVRFTGAHLATVASVEFIFGNGQTLTLTNFNPIDDHNLDVPIPATPFPVGLAQVRVKNSTGWSKQYFGYFVLQ